MKKHRKQKLVVILMGFSFLAAAMTLAGFALKEQIDLFYSPSDIHNGLVQHDRSFRAGGLVKYGTVQRDPESLIVDFVLTDQAHDLKVSYQGILPDLFREGQGIVAMGELNSQGVFVASQVLAKHDEQYMPAEVKDALQRSGGYHQEDHPGSYQYYQAPEGSSYGR